jgi:hypothetical protein
LFIIIYTRINPTMVRYWAHIVPFLILPATVAVTRLSRHRLGLVAVLLVASMQLIISYVGLRAEPGNPWFRPGYEAVAAQRVAPHLPPGAVVISALPEPYFLITHHTVQAPTTQAPYLYLPDIGDRPIYIVQDEAMRRLFPGFSRVLDEKFQENKLMQVDVGTDFRYITQIAPEGQPLSIYKTNQSKLTSVIH